MVTYEEERALADKFKDASQFYEARKHYKRALNLAPADQMQDIIALIKEMGSKVKTQPPADKRAELASGLGFFVYQKHFGDVIGYKHHKKIAKRIIGNSLDPKGLLGWFKRPKSTMMLLYGPPGTGKTLFAKSLSGEFKLPMKDVNINDVLGKHVGDSEKNMAQLFIDAKVVQPSVLFFDELDALGASREKSNDSTSSDVRNTVNVLLKQTSELHDNKETCVFVIGATNLPWLIDDAIKRSGRLEHSIYLGPPAFLDRMSLFWYYLELHKEGSHYGKGIDIVWLALATIRFSQADIESVCDNAFRMVAEKGQKYVTTRDLQISVKERIKEGTLDSWYTTAYKTYIKSEQKVTERTGILGWRKQKKTIEESGKLSEGEKRLYRPLINNIKSTRRWWHIMNGVRWVARGI